MSLKIYGNLSPKVGKDEKYTIKEPFEGFNIFPPPIQPIDHKVKWCVYVLENGNWRKTKENAKTGETVSYTFTQKSLSRKGIKIEVQRGFETASEVIKPQRAEEQKILKVELLDAQENKLTKPLSYGQTVVAKATCTGLDFDVINFTLWEDDAKGAGHNTINIKNKTATKPAEVKRGIAKTSFKLMPSFDKMAKAFQTAGGEGKLHEYYVTASLRNLQSASNNIDVNALEEPAPPVKKKVPIIDNTKPKTTNPIPATPSKPVVSKKAPSKKGITDVKIFKTSETTLKAHVYHHGLQGKKIRFKLMEGDGGALFDDELINQVFDLPKNSDCLYIDIDLKTIPKSKGDDMLEGWEQELFVDIEVLETDAHHKTGVLNVKSTGFKQDPVDDSNKVVKVGATEKKEKEEKTGTCVCKEDDLTWGGHPNVSCDFRKKVVAISKRQNFDPNHLMAVMWVESAKTFSSSKIDLKVIGYNSKGKELRDYVPLSEKEIKDLPVSFSGAVGLIQFTPVAIDELNNYYGYSLTKRKLALMTQIDQLDYVEKYIEYWRTANKITIKLTLADLYLLVFAPSKMNGSVDSTTLYKEGTVYYKANASVDTDKKHGITKKELAHRAYESFEEGNKKENKASSFSCGVIIEKKIKEVSSEGVLSEMKTLADSHKSYLQETNKNRTADTDAGLEKMDCSEFVSRYLHKLGVTKNIIYMTTANMTSEAAFRKVIENDNIDLVSESKTSKFKPQKGDIFAWGRSKNGSWGGHTGVVYDFDETKDTVTILESIGKVGAVGEKKQVKNGGHSGTNCTRTAVYDRLGGALYGHDGWFGYYRPKNYTKKL